MSSASPETLEPPAADVAEDSATSAAAANQSAGTTPSDGAVIPTPNTVVQSDPASAPLPPDTSSVPPSPTTISNPAPSTLSTSDIQLSLVFQPGSSSSLLQTPSTSTIFTSLVPDVQVTNISSTAVPAPVTGNGLNTGAVVGIAIGCTAAGSIIGLLASLILFRRHTQPGPDPQAVDPPDGHKSFDYRAFMATPLEPAGAASGLDQFLPVPKSDRELAGELQSLGYLIQQHVEDNYHLLPARQGAGVLSQGLADLGLGDGGGAQPGPARLTAMALDPEMRVEALQHVIARIIFGSLTVKSFGKISMLPPLVSTLVREMPPCEKHMGNPEAISVALTRWRQITAFLLNPRRSERDVFIPGDASLEPQAAQLVVEMNKFLGDFIDEKNCQHQKHHLQDVVVECAKFGHAIFSQPADFTWKFVADGGGDIVVCPGMEKVSDSQGVRCQPEMTISPEVRRV